MDRLHCEPCQIRGKAHKEAEALEERPLPSETWRNNSNKATRPGPVHSSEVGVESSAFSIPFSETLLGLIVKMPASLQPVCCDGSPVLLPVQVQQAGEIEPETIATSVITPSLDSLTLPLIFDQPQVQYSLLENNGLSQNLSLTIGQSHSCKGKSENTAMYSSEFISSLQQLISSPHCRGSSSFPTNAFGASFIPPDSTLSHLYTGSPPVSLLPPATLLVPFPFVVPLPVPLPIPIPIPFIPDSCLSRASHTIKTSKSTQTEYISVCTHNRMSGYDFLQLPKQPLHPVSQEEVLDLTVKVVPMQTNREIQFHQDHALDLSVANKSCFNTNLIHHGRNSENVDSTKLILPMKCSPTQVTNQPNGYSDMEFSMHYKWTTEKRYEKYSLKYSNQNGSVVSPKHIPRVSQSAKDASVRICEQIVRSPQGQVLNKKIDKKKRVNSQNINNSPIKKQHLMTFCSSK